MTNEDRIKVNLYQAFIAQDRIAHLYSDIPPFNRKEAIKKWFNQDSQVGDVKHIACCKFFQLDHKQYAEAVEHARIYAPGNWKDHNWGLNAAWVLALLKHKVPLELRSVIRERTPPENFPQGVTRNHKPPDNFCPSAFALELSIALRAGFTFIRQGENIILKAPDKKLDERVTGVPGKDIIPTRLNQTRIHASLCRWVLRREVHYDEGSFEEEELAQRLLVLRDKRIAPLNIPVPESHASASSTAEASATSAEDSASAVTFTFRPKGESSGGPSFPTPSSAPNTSTPEGSKRDNDGDKKRRKS